MPLWPLGKGAVKKKDGGGGSHTETESGAE